LTLLGFDAAQHSVHTGLTASLTTSLTMVYILTVNPAIFSAQPGMPGDSVFSAFT
jgi:xanthine/uracil/vitamin C permease (AzgA family)